MRKLNRFLIRKATEKDLDDLLKLRVQFAMFEKALDPEVKFNPKVKSRLRDELVDSFKKPTPYYLVGTHKKSTLGYLNVHFYPDLPKTVYIGEFFVDKRFRNRGFGTKILKTASNFLKKKGIQEIRLNTYKNNRSAIKFFRKFGFIEQNSKTIILSYKILSKIS